MNHTIFKLPNKKTDLQNAINNKKLNNWLFERVYNEQSRSYVCKYDLSYYYPENKLIGDKSPEPKKGNRYYEGNNLFKELVDYSFATGLLEEDGNPVISIRNKKGFLKYIFEHSTHP